MVYESVNTAREGIVRFSVYKVWGAFGNYLGKNYIITFITWMYRGIHENKQKWNEWVALDDIDFEPF